VKVLDLSRLIVGSLTTRYLADFGAEVVKVEDPVTGDYLRAVPPMIGGDGVWHRLLNRNKRSVALDVTDPADHDQLLALVDAADVVVEVSRPGSLARLGIDISAIRRERPELVVCSISAFGQVGPLATLPAHGMNMDSLAAMSAVASDPEHGHRFVQLAYTSFGNELGAMHAALAVTASIVSVRAGGAGAWIDISCWDALVELNRTAIAYLAATGRPVQEDNAHLWGPMHRLYTTKDDRLVFLAVIEQKFWSAFCEGIGRPDLLDRWVGDSQVDYGSADLQAELEPIMASKTAEEWGQLFVEWSIPGSPVLDLDELVTHPHFAARALLEADGAIPNMASPVRWMEPVVGRPGAEAPLPHGIGEDTEAVLAEWVGERVPTSRASRGGAPANGATLPVALNGEAPSAPPATDVAATEIA
jgi:crotonobetainyl-CoA:carnitine CoA-transferase CaiB-like acyl-CoA transferase